RRGSGAAWRSRRPASRAAPPGPARRSGPAGTRVARRGALASSPSPEQGRQLRVQHLGRHGADVLVQHHAVAGHEERLRHAEEAPVDAHRAVVVDDVGEREAEEVYERPALGALAAVLRLHADEHDARVLVPLPVGLQHGRLVVTGGAPRGPEVDDQRPALELLERERLAELAHVVLVHRQLERGRWLALEGRGYVPVWLAAE